MNSNWNLKRLKYNLNQKSKKGYQGSKCWDKFKIVYQYLHKLKYINTLHAVQIHDKLIEK